MIEGEWDKAEVSVRVLKFDGTQHRSWRARVMRCDGALLVLYAAFEEEVQHSQLGLIERGTVSIEYYWLDRWYNVFRFLEPDGRVSNFYCNVNMPPRFDGSMLTYIDLDIDIVVSPDLSYEILDMDEFETNAERFMYPLDVLRSARGALREIVALIESREFPFDSIE